MNDETRDDLRGAIVDGILSEMSFEQMRQYVWDSLYDDLLNQADWELEILGGTYAPDWLDSLTDGLEP